MICLWLSLIVSVNSAFADYTIAAGTTINASTLSSMGLTGVLTIYGTLNVDASGISLKFTSVILDGTAGNPNGQINWSANPSSLTFPSNTSINLINNANGLQPTGATGSRRLYIGGIEIAVSNGGSAIYTFAQFNALGGLPSFSLSSNSPICNGSTLLLIATPSKLSIKFSYLWTSSASGITPPTTASTSTGIDTVSTVPIASGSYNLYCQIKDKNGNVIGKDTLYNVLVNSMTTISGNAQAGSVCSGSAATVSLTGLVANSSNNTINYTINGVAQTAVSGVNADGSGNASFPTGILTSAANGQSLKITNITGGGTCANSFTSNNCILAITSTGTWLGVNTNWFDASNWCGGVPTSATNAIIPAGLANYPTISTSTGAVNNISLASGTSLTTTSTLQVKGTITCSGSLNFIAGNLEMNGSGSAQSVDGSWFVNKMLSGLMVSNPVGVNISSTANDSLIILDHVGFGNVNNSVLNTGDNLVLRSTATATARVSDVTNGGINSHDTITGKATIERYLPMQNSSVSRRWRLLTAPIQSTGAPTLNASWQEGAHNSIVSSPINPKPGYGTEITNGNSAAAVANGYDIGTTANPSIYCMVPGTTPGWTIPPNTSLPITNYETYMIFVRGDRSIVISNQYIAACPTTLEVKGNLNVGDITKNLVTGYQSIGNPYASAISFDNVVLNGATAKSSLVNFYVWDPKTSGSYQVGKFLTVGYEGDGSCTVSPSPNGSGITDGTIQSGDAVVVVSYGAPNTITFHETDKIATSNTIGVASRTATNTNVSKLFKLYTNLYAVNSDSSANLADGVASSYYPTYNNSVDQFDALKTNSFNSKENLSISREGKLLAIEKRMSITNDDTIFFAMRNMSNMEYRFEFIPQNFQQGMNAFLEDNYLSTSTPLNLIGTNKSYYNFTVNNSIAASADINRFRIVFKPASPSGGPIILPVKFDGITANSLGKDIHVTWKVENELNIKKYEVEKSPDGVSFTAIGSDSATGNNSSTVSYSFVDQSPFSNSNYYRIKSVDNNGGIEYSPIAKVELNGITVSSVNVFPTVVNNETVNLQLTNMPKGTYNILLLNSLGQVIYKQQLNHFGGSITTPLNFNQNLSKGIYQINVIKPDLTQSTFKIVCE